MCGRYALGVRLAFIRYQLQQQGQRVDEAPDDDEVRESYNFAPGYYGAVYRADTSDQGGYDPNDEESVREGPQDKGEADAEQRGGNVEHGDKEIKYKLQSMKWGLVPFWTKRSPDYGSLMRTINCRDDSLVENRGMWTSMKKKKRCIVVCQGFYEWLKKGPSGKEKVPHFIKRKDGNLMCFAGLWDCVQYEGSDEKLYTYTIITTSSNSQLQFIHDRMPVILDAGSDAMATWLDPKRIEWTNELQSLLKPYGGELEYYPVSKDVGKVGNNSADFIIPVNSKENKQNIANFFGAKKEGAKMQEPKIKQSSQGSTQESKVGLHVGEPVSETSFKREHTPEEDEEKGKPAKVPKTKQLSSPPSKSTGGRQMRSSTSNGTSPAKASGKKAGRGTPRITSFFKK